MSVAALPAVTPAIDRYCEWIARQFYAPGQEHQDLVQEARIGVWKAQRDYDASRGQWEAFAKLAAKRMVITAVKTATRGKHGPLNRSVPYDAPIGAEDDDMTLAELLPGAMDIAVEHEQRERAKQLLNGLAFGLSRLEAEVLGRHASGMDYAEVAVELGLSTKTVDNALQRARRKAQVILAGYDEGEAVATWGDKNCQLCGERFAPTGPRSLYCPPCKEARDRRDMGAAAARGRRLEVVPKPAAQRAELADEQRWQGFRLRYLELLLQHAERADAARADGLFDRIERALGLAEAA